MKETWELLQRTLFSEDPEVRRMSAMDLLAGFLIGVMATLPFATYFR